MPSQFFPLAIDDFSGDGDFFPLAGFNKIPVIVIRDETDLLTFRFLRYRQSQAKGFLPHLGFRFIPQRQKNFPQLVLGQEK